jgi:archaellum component FlaC
MQEDIRKRDTLIQELYKHLQSPTRPTETNIAQQLADAKKEIEQLKESTSQLKQSQQDLSQALNTPEKMPPSTSTHRVRDRVGKWQEFLETPISASQRRSRQTPRQHSRYTISLVFRG